eukprot:4448940-Amphidinium_carterae.1
MLHVDRKPGICRSRGRHTYITKQIVTTPRMLHLFFPRRPPNGNCRLTANRPKLTRSGNVRGWVGRVIREVPACARNALGATLT